MNEQDFNKLKLDVQELLSKIKDIERWQQQFSFDKKLEDSIIRTFNRNFFISGTATLNGSGAAEFPIPGGTDTNLVFVQDSDGISLATGLINSDITPGFTKLYLAGTADHVVYYVVFPSTNNLTSIQ